MRFIYIGGVQTDGTPMPAETTAFGINFACNVVTEVTDAHVIAKLSNHPHFRTVPEPMEAVAALSEDEATQLVENVLEAPAPKKRGRPRKVVASDIADAAE